MSLALIGSRIWSKIYSNIWLAIIILIAAFLRLFNIRHGASFHPDERHIVMVTEGLSWNDPNPHSFAYGSFPFYLLWLVSEALGKFWPWLAGYDGLFVTGRCISVAFGLAAIFLTYRLALLVNAARGTAILAALLLAFNVLHIQLSRFYAFDVVLTTVNLAALFPIVLMSQRTKVLDFICAGFLIGLSLATKISSLSLLIPLAAAFIIQRVHERKFFSAAAIMYLQLSALVTICTFLLVEPYALLDFKTFWANTNEQMGMVKGEWRPPYTIQYEGTAPYVYHLQQILNYTMGWPLGIAAILGSLWAVTGQFRRRNLSEVVLLCWLIAVFFVIGSYKVKYPRYLLPLYPLLCIFAASFLAYAKDRLPIPGAALRRWLLPAVVAGWTTIYAFAFSAVYTVDHVYVIASRWMYDHLKPHSRILGVDWDDKLPLHLPGKDPNIFEAFSRECELRLYEGDSPQKLETLSTAVARGHYIALPTQRQQGSIPRIPQELAISTNFYKLLYAEKLGYKLLQTFKVRPKLGPLVFNDDLADESFSVYDHPKVTIFENVERLTPEEIRSRLVNPDKFEPLPDMREIMLRDSGQEYIQPGGASTSARPFWLLDLLKWYAALQLVSIGISPLIACAFWGIRGSGYGASKVISLVLLCYLSWLSSRFGFLPATPLCLWIIALFLIAIAHALVLQHWGSWGSYFKKLNPEILRVELLFAFTFIILIILRAFNPEIFWGEKPMDFTFLNYFIRLNWLPPDDPWAAGQEMQYYYLGTFLAAALHKLSGVDSAVGYNFCIATVAALLVCSLYAVFRSVWHRSWLAALSALGLVFLSNWEVLNLAILQKRTINFDLYWASTRLFTSPGITEYPFWSLLFSDLHAHLIALPLTASVLALAVSLIAGGRSLPISGLVLHRLLLSVCLASLVAFNTWDFISYALVLGILLVFCRNNVRERPLASLGLVPGFRLLTKLARDVVSIFLITLLCAAPFIVTAKSSSAVGYGWVTHAEFNTLSQVTRHLGHWLVPIIIGSLFISFRKLMVWGRRVLLMPTSAVYPYTVSGVIFSASILLMRLTLSLAPLFLGLVTYFFGIRQIPWGILALASLLICISFSFLTSYRLPNLRVAGGLLIAAGFLISGSELIFLMDRMNTIFKFYNSVWLLLGISSFLILPYITGSVFKKRRPFLMAGCILFGLSILTGAIALPLASSVLNGYVMTRHAFISGPRPTLNGMAYLEQANPDEFALLNWMRTYISGTPVILEAHGNSYGSFSRITMNTGLPTVLGWDHHVSQRGTPGTEIHRRKQDIRLIYSSPTIDTAVPLLQRYNVRFIVVSKLERSTYAARGLKKFSDRPDVFPVLFKARDTVLYGVKY